MTKPITAVAIMTLYEEGYFTLNTPISEFIPGFQDVKVFVRETEDDVKVEDLIRPITFRHLFTHTAGLSYGGNQDDPVDRWYIKLQKEAGIDRAQALYGLLMTQHSPNNYYPLADTFKQLTYQALVK